MPLLKFQKMWEAADLRVFDIDTGSVLPIIRTLPKVASFADTHWLFRYADDIGAAYYEESDMEKAAEAGLHDFSDPSYRSRFFDEITSMIQRHEALYNELQSTSLSEITIDQLRGFFVRATDTVVENFGYTLATQPQCVSLIEKRVQERLAGFVPADQVADTFGILSVSSEPTKIEDEERDWLNLLVAAKNSSVDINALLQAHHRRYFLLTAADGHAPMEFAQIKARFESEKTRSTEEISSSVRARDGKRSERETERSARINTYKVPADIVDDCNILAAIGHARFEMRFAWMAGYYYDRCLLREIARRFSYDYDLLRFATVAEVLGVFESNSPDSSLLSERSHGFLFVVENGTSSVLSGEEASLRMKSVLSNSSGSANEVTGNVAMTGTAQAPALVFRWGDNLDQRLASAPETFILVAGQTRPQLMPLILKCSGIITDEGGITSHAAIVSREFKKPCLIGTKNATEIFKDGDEIFLDATNRIARIIEKK